MRRGLLVAAVVLAWPAAAQAQGVYRWTADVRSYSYTKQVCDRSPYTVTEIITQELINRGSGVSHVGDGRELPRGSSVSSGRVRSAYSKSVQGPDPAPPEDYTVTETLPMVSANWGAVNRAGRSLAIDVPGAEDAEQFSRLKKGQSITIRIDQEATPGFADDGRCVTESTGRTTGTVTITRVR